MNKDDLSKCQDLVKRMRLEAERLKEEHSELVEVLEITIDTIDVSDSMGMKNEEWAEDLLKRILAILEKVRK